MPEGLLMMATLFEQGIPEVVETDENMAATFYTYAFKSAEAMMGHNDEVNDADMTSVMEKAQAALTAMNRQLDDIIIIGDAANDFDASFQALLKPYIGVIGTYLGVKGVK